MPRASEHVSSSITKLLYLGDSGTGKTTSLASLVAAGYKLRILDFDNLLDSLIAKVKRDTPDKLDNIEFVACADTFKSTPNGPVVAGVPRAFTDAMKFVDKWDDDSTPATWGPEYILVVDTLTRLAQSAYWWAKGLQGASSFAEGVSLKGVDPRKFFHTAQSGITNTIQYITSRNFNTNVIVVAHVKYMEHDGIAKGYPVAVGNAISPELPGYFPSVALATKSQSNKRIIRTRSTNMFDLKNPRSFDMADEFDMEDGLAKFFAAVKP